MPLLAFALPSFDHVLLIVMLVLGFGFVIFFHELGHFIAAKWVGIKVEQFAVGFGHALFSWRKGVGFRVGNTQREYRARLEDYLNKHGDGAETKGTLETAGGEDVMAAEKQLGLGATEYRLNWIPLGGYVKMLGQDDLRPNSQAEDPRSYNRKSIGARMLVVSAGVIMNVILAGIGFMVLFMIGFHVPPAWVGAITTGSPAQNAVRLENGKPVHAPLEPGDRILAYDDSPQEDFTKIGLNVALSAANAQVPLKVRRVDGREETVYVIPEADDSAMGFLSIGIAAPHELRGPDPDPDVLAEVAAYKDLEPDDAQAVQPGETITQINGANVDYHDFWRLDEALQNPAGNPVELTVTNRAGQVRHTRIHPHFTHPFSDEPLAFGGMMPRPRIPLIMQDSPVKQKVMPGDVVVSISVGKDTVEDPTLEQFRQELKNAADANRPVAMQVLRDGKPVSLGDLSPSMRIETGKGKKNRGLGVGLGYDDQHPVIAGTVPNSPAYNAGIPAGARITSISNQYVATWFDVQRLLGQAKAGSAIVVHFVKEGVEGSRELRLSTDDIFRVQNLRRANDFVVLREYQIDRKARNPAQAAWWGVTETRDFILQFYLTLRRMAGGSVSPNQLMGPVGIFVGGAKFAIRGWDWLLWFLAMISANLAVVNFLPIPIVDGGLFTFLILEKIQGRPLSPKAQAIAQYAGLAFLAGVFLFVTYHDIVRYIPWWG